MSWYKSKILKKLFLETTDWNVAWKKDDSDRYEVIQNPEGYWLADSLVFSCYMGVFLFVEAFDKKENIGKIAVLKYNGNSFTDFKIIMEKPYHLSYPFVFEYNKEFYMIPETSDNDSIEIYKSINFPYEWKKEKKLLCGKYVDTTLYNLNGRINLFSYNVNDKILIKGNLNMLNLNIENVLSKVDNENKFRAGGNVFFSDGNYCRAVQNNKYFYGQSLYIIDCLNDEILYEIIPTKIKNSINKKYRRLHTYSKSGDFEAIDLSNFKFNLLKIINKLKK